MARNRHDTSTMSPADLRALVRQLQDQNEVLREGRIEALAAAEDDDDTYHYGCGEFDTVDSKGRPLRNGGRTCNDAGEPYWM